MKIHFVGQYGGTQVQVHSGSGGSGTDEKPESAANIAVGCVCHARPSAESISTDDIMSVVTFMPP